MNQRVLAFRGLTYYWRTNLAVILGVATAIAVLAGALLVGDSVRGSLRDLVLQRLGRTDHVVMSTGFFREQLAEELRGHPDFRDNFEGVCPIIVTQGFVTRQSGRGRAGQVRVYGIDERFFQFHGFGYVTGTGNAEPSRTALITPALARELGAGQGETILIRVQSPSEVPLESLHGRKENLGQTIRATVSSLRPDSALGEFSLEAQQGEVRAVFLPLGLLQRSLDVRNRVNALLVSAKPERDRTGVLEQILKSKTELEDLGLKLRALKAQNMIALEADGGLLDDTKAKVALEAARDLGLRPQPIFTYLANSLSSGSRNVPYSLVTAMDLAGVAAADPPPIVLNDWAARDLGVAIGDPVKMEYYVWEDPGRLVTRTTEFRLSRVVPINTGDRDLAPLYRGISDAKTVGDWNPPFPIDLSRVRRVDEEYWEKYRTTPKAFIPAAVGQRLWRSRYGAMTSIRLASSPGQPLDDVLRQYGQSLREKMDPRAVGFAVNSVRSESLQASRGATDFGEYFVYFSFFLVISALMLAALFFKLSIEQRAREVGLLRSIGFKPAAVRRILMGEGFLLSCTGAAVGVIGGVGYAFVMVTGLRTWWVGAVGTTAITLHVSPMSLVAGALGGIIVAMVCIWFTLRGLGNISERRLLAGQLAADTFEKGHARRGSLWIAAIGFAFFGVALSAGGAAGLIEKAGAFFGAGTALLGACLCVFVFWFRLRSRNAIEGSGWGPVSRLGVRNAMYRPARSVLSIATIASATFILISVDSFRRDSSNATADPHSGVGGYSLLVESLLPFVHDPASREGREILGLAADKAVKVAPFRVRPGDDASCLNLYEPRNPRILAPKDSFIAEDRFAFGDARAATDSERANPWLLLRQQQPDGAVPVIADANSMTYVLHRKLGEDIVIPVGDSSIRLRLVASLYDSIFQGELLMSEANFLKLFPEEEGYRFLLIEAPPGEVSSVSNAIEEALADFGADARSTAERLAEFHRVENTYLSTFQMLGGLGLLLGTVGLGAVLLRNVFERRRELAMLRALGYKQAHFFAIVIAENALLLVCGLFTGIVCAVLAIAPVLLERGGRLPAFSLLMLLCGVLATGLITSVIATAAALRSPLLAALRTE